MADRFANYQAGIEHLIAQLYSLEAMYNTAIPSIVPSLSKFVWGNIGGDITKQKDLINTLAQLKKEIEEEAIDKISAAFVYKGSVPTFEDLPTTDVKSGDCYNVESTGANYVWSGENWDKLSETFDTSTFVAKTELDGILEFYYLKSEIDTLINNLSSELGLRITTNANSITDLRSYVVELNNSVVNELNAEIQARTNADTILQNNIDTKVDKEITSANGKALIFNETDGGGAKFEGADGINSFAGVNDRTDAKGVGVQLYTIDTNDGNKGPCIQLTTNRATYSKDITQVGEEYEILVRGDLTSVTSSLEDKIDGVESKIDDFIEESVKFAEQTDLEALDERLTAHIEDADANAATKTELAEEVTARKLVDAEFQLALDKVASDLQNHIEEAEDDFVTKAEFNEEKETRLNADNTLQANINKKVDKDIVSSIGKAKIFNESDGGGAKFEFNNNHASFVGVNGDSNGIMAQIYAKNTQTNIGSRINVTKDGVYYTVKDNSSYTAGDEIVVKNDLTTLETSISESLSEINSDIANLSDSLILKANLSETYTKTEVNDLIADLDVETIFHFKGSLVTVADLNNVENPKVGDVYNITETGANYAWSGTVWDKLSETIDLTPYDTIAAREAAMNALLAKIWTGTLANGHLYSKKTNAQGGYALIFNESDGGGSQVYDKTDDVISYVGTNLEEGEGAENGVNVQIYSKNKTTNEGVRINVNTQKAYYLKGANVPNPSTREIAVVEDVASVQQGLTDLENSVNDSISTQNGNIQSLVLQIQELYSKITDLKSLDYEVYTFYDGSDSDLENEEKAFMLSGVITTGTRVDGQAITLDDATMESSYVEFDAIEDITIKNTAMSGNVAKATTNALFKLHADGYISLRDCVITPETAYNGIEIGLSTGLAKSVIIDNCTFDGKFSNNGISIFGMDNGGVITISNCYFKEVSNLLRLSNRTNTSWTINLINCVCDKWGLGEYAGMMLLQDYTSGSAIAADENDQFSKLTINIQNCTKPDGTKIVPVEDLSTICGSQDNNQIVYMWDAWRNHTEYGNKYPTINII